MALPLIIGFVILVLLLAMSALVSGSEVAFFSLGPVEMEELDNNKSKTSEVAISLIERPKHLLAIILISNNFINVGIIILSTYLSDMIFVDGSVSANAKFLIDVVVITFLLLLFGEVIPKIYATKHGMQLTLLMAKPLNLVGKIPPFSWLRIGLVQGTSVISNLGKKKSHKISTDELTQAVELTIGETADQMDKKIWQDIVRFGEKDVKQIMQPRVDVVAIDIETGYNTLFTYLVENKFSRIPVYKGTFDKIEGILFIKDLLPHLEENDDFEWQKLIREPYYVPENKKIDDLMNNFQELKVHMAIVVDEYGGTSGIVTLEDVLEEIVGDIADEFDEDDLTYSKLDDNNYVFEGKTPLVDLYKVLDIEGAEFEEAKSESDTLAGFVIEQAGKILKKGERVKFSNFTFQIEAADARKVKRIKVTINEPKEQHEA
ncbi:MAG: gliding motility-associated protein GldE [Crocinitomicaceae bacterium]|nr:gliding motility-associated protein GldE [Crocinitomicaceae bacterium]